MSLTNGDAGLTQLYSIQNVFLPISPKGAYLAHPRKKYFYCLKRRKIDIGLSYATSKLQFETSIAYLGRAKVGKMGTPILSHLSAQKSKLISGQSKGIFSDAHARATGTRIKLLCLIVFDYSRVKPPKWRFVLFYFGVP